MALRNLYVMLVNILPLILFASANPIVRDGGSWAASEASPHSHHSFASTPPKPITTYHHSSHLSPGYTSHGSHTPQTKLSFDPYKRDVTPFPVLVPTSSINFATDLPGSQDTIITRPLTPVVSKSTLLDGCIIMYKHTSAYGTFCPEPTPIAPAVTGIPPCCGGIYDLYPCPGDDEPGVLLPTGTSTWTCTLGTLSAAGASGTATTTWS